MGNESGKKQTMPLCSSISMGRSSSSLAWRVNALVLHPAILPENSQKAYGVTSARATTVGISL